MGRQISMVDFAGAISKIHEISSNIEKMVVLHARLVLAVEVLANAAKRVEHTEVQREG